MRGEGVRGRGCGDGGIKGKITETKQTFTKNG